MKGARDTQFDGLAAMLGSNPDCAGQRFVGTADHGLIRGVVIGQRCAGLVGDRLGRRAPGPDQRQQAAGTLQAVLIHGLPALPGEAQRRLDSDCAGERHGRIDATGVSGHVAERADPGRDRCMFGDRPGNQEGLQQRRTAQPCFIGLFGAQPKPPEIAIRDFGSESKGLLALRWEFVERFGEIGHAAGALRALSRTNQDGREILIH